MKKACIIVNAYATLNASSGQAHRIKDELETRGVSVDILKNGDLSIGITESGDYFRAPHSYDFCVYLDKDKYTSKILEKSGMRLFNRHEPIQICDDKMETFLYLCGHGIPMPQTIPAPLSYYPGNIPCVEFISRVESTLGLPIIAKECYGSLGAQVHLAKTHEELFKLATSLQGKQHLFQKFIKESAGRDIRVIVIGGKVCEAMMRISDSDFRSNIELGGHGEPFELPKEAADICERTAALIGLDYCGIDLLFTKDGFYLCEVNSNAFFEGIEAVTGTNIAGHYADHIYNTVYL